MITQHQYLDQYPIAPRSKILILGTIHPHNTENFKILFFYGNKNSIWNLLSEAFPDDLKQSFSLENILSFLNRRQIAVSDTIRQCRRINLTALDKDLIPEILYFNILNQIRDSQIERILCTSGFGVNNAFRLFYKDILEQNITQEIRKEKQVMLNSTILGRPILIKVLYSPSGSSNVPLSTSDLYLKCAHKYLNSSRPVYDFKVDYYRKQFSG